MPRMPELRCADAVYHPDHRHTERGDVTGTESQRTAWSVSWLEKAGAEPLSMLIQRRLGSADIWFGLQKRYLLDATSLRRSSGGVERVARADLKDIAYLARQHGRHKRLVQECRAQTAFHRLRCLAVEIPGYQQDGDTGT